MLKYFSINTKSRRRVERRKRGAERERERETDLLVQIRNLLTADVESNLRWQIANYFSFPSPL